MRPIPVAVTAKNEEQALGSCLPSLLASVEEAESKLGMALDLIVVLDDCTDRSEELLSAFERIRVIRSSGGIVEAQRAALQEDVPFHIFSDADILVEKNTVTEICRAMLEDRQLMVAYPSKAPLPVQHNSLLARALYVYNHRNGFQTKRHYFNGKFFAIRHWHIPSLAELAERVSRCRKDRFYDFENGMNVDDVFLSRMILLEHGPLSIKEIQTAQIWFRTPETFAGMYQTYKRMRREIEKLDILFPETQVIHQVYGRRRYDQEAIRGAESQERWLWRYFRLVLQLCKIRYAWERLKVRSFPGQESPEWEVIPETKVCLKKEC